MTVDTLPVSPTPAVFQAGDVSVHESRIAVLRQRMRSCGLAAVGFASPEDIYYLTGLDHLGYFAFTFLVVPDDGTPIIVTRFMEWPTIRAQLPWCRHATFGEGDSPAAVVAAAISSVTDTGNMVALDETSTFFPPTVARHVRALLPAVRWVGTADLLTTQRAVKSDQEVGHVRRAAALSDRGMAVGLAALGHGVPEREVAAEVYRAMIAAGSEPPGFPPLIRSTARLGQEHVTWSDSTIDTGQGLFFELSGSFRHYHAPHSRTVYVGHAPAAAAEAADIALAGLVAARDTLRPGVRTGEVYAAWQRVVAGSVPPATPLRHHCGYLVGIGFPPSWVGGGEVLGISAGGERVIEAGMTFHLMSWVTEPIGHVISDTTLVTNTGAEFLTTTPRELMIL